MAPGIKLKILPLGDSITFGDGGSDGNAYRLELRKALVAGGMSCSVSLAFLRSSRISVLSACEFLRESNVSCHTMLTYPAGSEVDYIGSQTSGKENEDNQHEGWGGARISGVLERVLAQGTLRQHPNVILLMAGTNDMKDHPAPEPADDAPHRLGVLIDAILCECPDAVLIVAKVTGQRPLFANLRVDKFNTAIEGVVAERAHRGSKVKLIDQSKVAALELADDLHPNDGMLIATSMSRTSD